MKNCKIIKFLLVFLPALVLSKIQVNITVKNDDYSALHEVTAHGVDIAIISDAERTAFHINDEELAKLVEFEFDNQPTNVYVKSPTPWGDLYKSYGWQEVKRIYRPIRAQLLPSEPGKTLDRIYLDEKNFDCGFTIMTCKFKYDNYDNFNLKKSFLNNVTHSRSGFDKLTPGNAIEYQISIPDSEGNNHMLKYELNSNDDQYTKSYKTTIGNEISINLDDYYISENSFNVFLAAYVYRRKIKIYYEVSLEGNVAINFDPRYRGHHFWTKDINLLLQKSEKPTKIEISETIAINHVTNGCIRISELSGMPVESCIPKPVQVYENVDALEEE